MWRGVIRATLTCAVKKLLALLAYDNKHPERVLLDEEEKAAIVYLVGDPYLVPPSVGALQGILAQKTVDVPIVASAEVQPAGPVLPVPLP